jgi:small subunit ribosomal protein S21
VDIPGLIWYIRALDGKGMAFCRLLRRLPNYRPFKTRGCRVQVLVRDNNVDQALKALKKKMQREGIFREMKLRGHYEKPSEKKAREKAEAVRRARKLARKKLQREGLLPMKPKPVFGAGPGADRGAAGGRGGPGAGPRGPR